MRARVSRYLPADVVCGELERPVSAVIAQPLSAVAEIRPIGPSKHVPRGAKDEHHLLRTFPRLEIGRRLEDAVDSDMWAHDVSRGASCELHAYGLVPCVKNRKGLVGCLGGSVAPCTFPKSDSDERGRDGRAKALVPAPGRSTMAHADLIVRSIAPRPPRH